MYASLSWKKNICYPFGCHTWVSCIGSLLLIEVGGIVLKCGQKANTWKDNLGTRVNSHILQL
jgi:hypothetical protein